MLDMLIWARGWAWLGKSSGTMPVGAGQHRRAIRAQSKLEQDLLCPYIYSAL